MIQPSLIGFRKRISFRSVTISKRIGAFKWIALRFYGNSNFADQKSERFAATVKMAVTLVNEIDDKVT